MKKFVYSVLIVYLFVVGITSVHAHGLGSSLEREVNGVLVDIGYDPENAAEGETVIYDFLLTEVDTNEPIEFSDIWIRISKDKNTYLATNLAKASLGKTTLAYAYPEEGEYEMYVRFTRDDGEKIETTFMLPVLDLESDNQNTFSILSLVFGLCIGLIIGLSVTFILRKSNSET